MPTSGLVTLFTRVRLSSTIYSVSRFSCSQSSIASTCSCTYSPFRNLFLGLYCAPLPFSKRSFAFWFIIKTYSICKHFLIYTLINSLPPASIYFSPHRLPPPYLLPSQNL